MSHESEIAITLTPASAAIAAKRFVSLGSGGVVAAGANAEVVGVASIASESGDTVAIGVIVPNGCKTEVEAGEALAVGDFVTSAAAGKAAVAGTGERVLGQVVNPAGADGEIATIVFIKGALAAA